MDTVLVGNGIIALTTAFRLAQRAAPEDRITIVGKRARPGSATLAAAAMLNSFAEIEAGALDSEIDLYRFELSHLATRMWPDFVKEIIGASGARLPEACAKCEGVCGGCFGLGTYIVNNAAADDLDDENFDAIVAALREFSEPFEHVSPKDIPNYMPEQRHRATRAIYIPNEGYLNPRLTVEALEAALGRYPQVRFIDAEADRLVLRGTEIGTLLLAGGESVAADKFVLAAGASISAILDRSALGIDIQRVFYGVGVSLEIDSPDFPHTKCIRTPNRGLACGIYSVPYFTDNSILIGASNFISPEPCFQGRLTSVESLLRAAIEQINCNFYRAGLLRVNVGWRPTSLDTYPLLGNTAIGNLIVASGTKRDGFHLSPLISQMLAALVHGEAVDERLAWFRPERAPLRLMTRQQAIDKAVRHTLSAAYQHDFRPSKGRMGEQVGQMIRQDLERVHDQAGAVDWGIPPEMLDMYRYGRTTG